MPPTHSWLSPGDPTALLAGDVPLDPGRLSLVLDRAPLDDVAHWLASDAPRGLTHPKLSTHPGADAALEALARASWAPDLEALVLSDLGASARAVAALAPALAGLRSLECYRTSIPGAAFVALSRSPLKRDALIDRVLSA